MVDFVFQNSYTSRNKLILFVFFFLLTLGAIIFGSDQEVREVMRAVRRNNATGTFSWIGSDGWSARNLVSDGNEPEVKYKHNLTNREIKAESKLNE